MFGFATSTMYHDDANRPQGRIESMELISPDGQYSTKKSFTTKCKDIIVPYNCKEGILTIFCVNCTILVFVLTILLNISSGSNNTICQTPACIQLAATLSLNMNKSVDPCEDFYEYTCGGWVKNNQIPDDRSRYSTFTQLYQQNEETLRRILDTKSKTIASITTATTAEEKAVLVYKSCIDEETIELAGSMPLKDIVSKVTWIPPNGLSQPFNTDTDRIQLAQTMALMSNHGITSFVDAGVGADDKNSTRNVMFVSQSGLSLPDRSYYIDKDIEQDVVLVALQTYMVELLTLYESENGGAGAAATYKQRAITLITFEQQLAIAMASPTVLRDPQKAYNVKNVQDLETQQSFGWMEYFKGLCGNNCGTIPTNVIVSSPIYLESIDQLLKNTESGILLDYLKWKTISSLAKHLTVAYQNIQFTFSKTVYGVQAKSDRWKKCVSRTDSSVGFSLGQLYVDKTFGGNSREIALEMIGDIRTVFEARLTGLSWMDAATQAKAKEKAEAVQHKIGYPDDLKTNEELDVYYASLENIKGNTYFNNMIQARLFETRNNMKTLNQPVDRNKWSMTPPTVNAYYSPSYNEIVFPAGILQSPFFNKNYLKANNFGGIGVVIGHELTHGFDDQGSQYDKDGNLNTWWPSSVTTSFKERTTCISKQYSDFAIADGEHVNGNLTLGENIADNGGLVQAFGAYRAWVARNNQGEEPSLPGLMDLTANQLFFVSFASVWCGNAREGEAHRLLVTDPHSPGKYRVIGTLSNSEDFAREFNCNVGSRMNPEKKCAVW